MWRALHTPHNHWTFEVSFEVSFVRQLYHITAHVHHPTDQNTQWRHDNTQHTIHNTQYTIQGRGVAIQYTMRFQF